MAPPAGPAGDSNLGSAVGGSSGSAADGSMGSGSAVPAVTVAAYLESVRSMVSLTEAQREQVAQAFKVCAHLRFVGHGVS